MAFGPVATFHGAARTRSAAPRQGVFAPDGTGILEFLPGHGFEQALRDLEGFSRLWVIFEFHQNEGWRPTVRPPIPPPDRDRVGVFASRSPYRPNPIGLSCVVLEKVEGLQVHISESDLLDGTPVLDIKPYIPAADAFPDARAGWVEMQDSARWSLQLSPLALEQCAYVLEESSLDLLRFAEVQLSHNPLDTTRKRLAIDAEHCLGSLACRTWRIDFTFETPQRQIAIVQIRSGYSFAELSDPGDDRYHDKPLHRSFTDRYPSCS